MSKGKDICGSGKFFFASLEAISPEKHFLFCSEYVKRYFIRLKSLGYNIYLRVII